ncbi:hypothetical protein V6N13_122202 [Hibiscus sabdariffa]
MLVDQIKFSICERLQQVSSSDFLVGDSLSLSSLKLALSYNEAVLTGRLTTSNGSIVQSVFLGSLRKRVEELLNCSEALKTDLRNYLNLGSWPDDGSSGVKSSTVLSWHSHKRNRRDKSVSIVFLNGQMKVCIFPVYRLLPHLPRYYQDFLI